MNEFLLIFHKHNRTQNALTAPEKRQKHSKYWADWYRGLAASDKLANPVQHFESRGKIVAGTTISDAAAAPSRSLLGIITLFAADYDEAVEIAKECPILELNGIVEIRRVI
jgi:hypothetical protein